MAWLSSLPTRLVRLLLRVTLAAGFLTAVYDQFGLWWTNGAAAAYWGDWAPFRAFTGQLHGLLSPATAWVASVAELVLGLALLTGYRLRSAAGVSAVWLIILGADMTLANGWKTPVYYSIWTAAMAALLLAVTTESPRAKAKRAEPTTRENQS